jgi:glucose uptake protein GlcU
MFPVFPCSIYTTQFLGLAVGWPLVQCQLLVSTAWGILYFRELTDTYSVSVTCVSSVFVLAGVIILGLFGL